MDVLTAISQRSSKRSFLDRPAPKEVLLDILEAAIKAPSAINLQPWELTVVRGEERIRLSKALVKSFRERNVGCGPGSTKPMPQRLKDRQFSSFIGLSKLLEAEAGEVQTFINEGSLDFYGAPDAIVITKEKIFPDNYLTSAGIMIGYLILAAEAHGLATCPIGLIKAYEDTILDFLNLEDHDLVLGLAIGYADPEAAVNRLKTPRESLDQLVHWYG